MGYNSVSRCTWTVCNAILIFSEVPKMKTKRLTESAMLLALAIAGVLYVPLKKYFAGADLKK